MADTSYAKKSATFTFDNDSTRKVTVGNFDPAQMDNAAIREFKSKIIAFNDSDVSKVSAFYFSNPDDEGNVYPVKGISAADVVITEKTVVYAKSESARLAALRESEVDNSGN